MELILNNVSSKNLQEININLKQNEISVLIGSNESKIEKIIKLICAKEKLIEGNIKYGNLGINTTSLSREYKKINNKIYHLTQNYEDMLFNITVREDIKYYMKKINKESLEELLNKFELSINILEKNYLELSSSDKKKILIIIALLSDAKIIILENITSQLDAKTIDTLSKQLKQLKRKNKIILITSYNTNFLLEVSDKIYAIDNGRIIKSGSKYEIFVDTVLLNKIEVEIPNIINFTNLVNKKNPKKIKIRDNMSDLLKEIYRNAK